LSERLVADRDAAPNLLEEAVFSDQSALFANEQREGFEVAGRKLDRATMKGDSASGENERRVVPRPLAPVARDVQRSLTRCRR
jgi:hypothetical protein